MFSIELLVLILFFLLPNNTGADTKDKVLDGSWRDLFTASRSGDIDTIRSLLQTHGNDTVNLFDEDGMLPLMIASKNDNEEVISFLLQSGSNVHAVENKGRSALYYAVEGEFLVVIDLLMKFGADPRQESLDGTSPYSIALRSENEEMLSLLDSHPQSNNTPIPTTASGSKEVGKNDDFPVPVGPFSRSDATSSPTPSSTASSTNVLRDPKAKAEHPFSLSTQPTPAMTFTSTGEASVDSSYDVNYADVNASADETEVSIQDQLLEKCRDGDAAEVAKLLKSKDINVDLPNERGWTALTFAASGGRSSVVKLLLDAGADVTVKESDGWTPLQFAAYVGNQETIELLLAANASVLVKANNGINALDAAILNANHLPEVVTIIATSGLKEAMLSKNDMEILAMVHKGANPALSIGNGWTPLLYFSSKKNLDGVLAVLDRCKDGGSGGRSVSGGGFSSSILGDRRGGEMHALKAASMTFGAACNARQVTNQVEHENGWTPLMFAASLNQEEMVRRLLRAGADTQIMSKNLRAAKPGGIITDIGEHFGKPAPSVEAELGETAISIALDRGYAYLADMIRRGDVQAQERAGVELSRFMKFRALKETQAMEFAKKEESSADERAKPHLANHRKGFFDILGTFIEDILA